MAKYISSLIPYKIGFRKLKFVDDKFSIKIVCSCFILIMIEKKTKWHPVKRRERVD